MLTKIREKASGIVAYFIVGLISIPFALWGINSYFEGATEVVVATVEGVDIDYNTYQQSLSERRRMMTQVMQQNLDSELLNSPVFKRQVVEELVRNTVEASHSQDGGYRVSDEALGQNIRQLPYFQNDGKFDPQRYNDLVRNAGMNVAMFEQQQRQQIITDQIRSAYTESAFVSEADLDRAIAFLEQYRQADYAVFSIAGRSPEDITVSDDEVSTYYEKNRESFFTDDEIKVAYVRLAVDDIAGEIEFDEEEVRQRFEENSGRYKDPEKRSVSHILIKLAEDAVEADVAEAESRASALAEQARAGEDFAELARTSSEDTGSAANGGDLGVLVRDQMVKPFEDAAYALTEAGQISDPVRSRFGFHIIRLDELVAESIKPFEEVRSEVEEEMRNRLAEEQFVERSDSFSNLVYEQPESLIAVEEELQLEISESEWFSENSGTGVAANPRFRRVAFSEEVRLEGLNSEAFELDANTLVAVRRVDFRDRRLQELDEVKDEIVQRIRVEKLTESAQADAAAAKQKLDGGASWDSVLIEYEIESLFFDGTRRDATDASSRALVQALFESKPPLPGQSVFGTVSGVNGDHVLYQFSSVTDADPTEVDEARREEIRNQLLARQSRDYYASYQDTLMQAADVEIFEDRLGSEPTYH